MDGDEWALFEETLRRACRTATGPALDHALDELGWPDALEADARTAVAGLFEQLGRSNAAASALGQVIAAALGVRTNPSTGLVLCAPGRWAPPGRIVGSRLSVRGLAGTGLDDATTSWVVVGSDADGERAVEVATADLTRRPVHGVDPHLGLVEVAGEDVPWGALQPLEPGAWTQAVARAHLALAHELVGASRTMLELARGHALERIQFGRPVAEFQAVRHRLAETLVAIEATDAALASAWAEGPPAAATAKALAGRSAWTTIRHGQQVLAGIGFTTEHDFHHYVRRCLVLDQLFGSSRSLTRELGRQLLATRQLPPVPPL